MEDELLQITGVFVSWTPTGLFQFLAYQHVFPSVQLVGKDCFTSYRHGEVLSLLILHVTS